MNRQQFLAELSQYLTFITPEQRDEVLAYYYARMQQAGPEGEAALLKEIGTPMTVAITLKRRLEASEPLIPTGDAEPAAPNMVKYMDEPSGDTAAESAPQSEPASPVWQAETPAQETAPAGDAADAPAENAEAAEAPVDDAGSPEPEEAVPLDTAEAASSEEAADEAEDEAEPLDLTKTAPKAKGRPTKAEAKRAKAAAKAAPAQTEYVKPKMTFGRFLLAICIAIASIAIVIFACFITAVGGVGIVSGAQIIISGLTAADVYLSDILIVVGGGAIVLTAGILVAWIGIWLAIQLITDMVRGFNKRPAPEVSPLHIWWKIIWIIFLVLLAAGVICVCVSMFMGGSVSTLTENEAYKNMLTRCDPQSYVDFFKNSGLFG